MEFELKNILIGFGLVVGYKFLRNLIRFLRVRYFYGQYALWLAERPVNLEEHQLEIIDLWKGAGIRDAKIPFTQPAGFGLVNTGTASAFRNFPSNLSDRAPIFVGMFNQAIGEYRRRMWQSINPLWWIEFVICLPRHVLRYLDISSEALGSKIVQLTYWLGASLFAIAAAFYQAEVRVLLDRLLSK